MSSAAAEIIVTGMVQGVGYRYYCLRSAHNLNLAGWVKNNFDGSVSSEVEGDRGMIEEYIKQLRLGPPASSVREVKVNWLPFQAKYNNFEITR